MQLSEKLIPKIPFSGVATYRMKTVGQINPISDPPGQPINPPTEILTGTIVVYDKFEQETHMRNKTLENITGSKVIYDQNNRPVTQNTVSDVEFNHGFVTINPSKQFNTFVFLERHPGNADNPFRDPSAPIIFERVKEEKTVAEQLNDESIAHLALNQAHAASAAEGRALLEALSVTIPAGSTQSDIKFMLIQQAKNNSRAFISANPSTEVKAKIQVVDAIAAQIVTLNEDDRTWKLNIGKKPAVIVNFDLGVDPNQALEDYLSSAAGIKTSQQIQAELDKPADE